MAEAEQQTDTQKKVVKKKNIVLRIIGGFNYWINSLLGRSAVVEIPQENVQEGTENQEPQEDSVAQDLKTFKTFMSRTKEKISKDVKPIAEKGAATTTKTMFSLGSLVEKKFIKRLIKMFLILFFLMVLVFIAIYLFKMLKENGGTITPPEVTTTPIPYQPYKPSVYADDPEVTKLEEDINILERELTNTNIKEERLNPPRLDMDVSF